MFNRNNFLEIKVTSQQGDSSVKRRTFSNCYNLFEITRYIARRCRMELALSLAETSTRHSYTNKLPASACLHSTTHARNVYIVFCARFLLIPHSTLALLPYNTDAAFSHTRRFYHVQYCNSSFVIIDYCQIYAFFLLFPSFFLALFFLRFLLFHISLPVVYSVHTNIPYFAFTFSRTDEIGLVHETDRADRSDSREGSLECGM